jgi:TonB family protein
MNCNEVAAILDDHRLERLTPAERCAVDEHVQGCEDCAAAWHAQSELSAMRLPPLPATLLDHALRVAHAEPRSAPRRSRVPFVVASALLAGAALAGIAVVSLTDPPTVDTTAAPTSATPAVATATTAAVTNVPAAAAAGAAQPSGGTTAVELVEIALAIAPIAIRPPDYPPDALARRLEGHVQVKFDVTTSGEVENVSVVESSAPVFEDSAVRAISTWRYLPRISAGKRVASRGIHTILRFVPGPEKPPVSPAERQATDDAARAATNAYTEFSAGLEVALDRFAADDLRGAELQLDEMYAIYDNEGNRAVLSGFYGYLYTVGGHYDRAINAYEAAITATRAGFTSHNQWVSLANLYFARHQYDMALRTLLNYKQRAAELQAQQPERRSFPVPEVDNFIERLRVLGVTEETLPQVR